MPVTTDLEQVAAYIPKELKALAQQKNEECDRSMSEYIEGLMVKDLTKKKSVA